MADHPTLSRPRRWPRRLLHVAGLLTLFCGLPIGACHWLYYWDLRDIEARLEAIPGVHVVHIWGNEDTTLEDVGAIVEVEGKGRITFFSLTRASFEPGGEPYLNIYAIGPYMFRTCSAVVLPDGTLDGRDWGGSGSFLLNDPSGPFTDLPVPVRSVPEVIQHYDELVAFLATQPRFPAFREDPCLVWNREGGGLRSCTRIFAPDGGLISDKAIERFSVVEGDGRHILRCEGAVTTGSR
jgi:hypothetical protein